jgi:PRTRC genetic system protein E
MEKPKQMIPTNFFSTIAPLLDNGDSVNINILKSGDKIIISVLPKSSNKEESMKSISPITLSGTSLEADNEFFNSVKGNMEQFKDFSMQAKAFASSMEKAKEESAMAKAEKDAKKASKEKIDKLIIEAKTAEEAKDLDKLRAIYKSVEALDNKSKHLAEITEMANKVKATQVQPDMFAVAEPISNISPNQTNLLESIKETQNPQ